MTARRTLRVDVQTHTNYSPSCGWMSPSALVAAAEKRGLDAVAVTDHNTLSGSQAAAKAAENVVIIPAEEVDTPDGQVIGLFLDEEIKPWQPPEAVIDTIHDQGGVAFAPHPFDAYREGLSTLDDHTAALDAIEVHNSRCVWKSFNDRAAAFAREHGLPGLGGSDAHFAHEVGAVYSEVKVDGPATDDPDAVRTALRDAIIDGRVSARGSRGSVLNHAGTKLVKFYHAVAGL